MEEEKVVSEKKETQKRRRCSDIDSHDESPEPKKKIASNTQEDEIKSAANIVKSPEKVAVKANPFAALQKATEGSWECPTCMITNKQDVLKCAACTEAKPGAKKVETEVRAYPFAALQKAAEGSWECPTCMITNKQDALKCAACTEAKPGAKKVSNSLEVSKASTFSFGMSGGSTSTTKGFSFGSSSTTSTASGFTFGSSNTTSSASANGFTFGTATASSTEEKGFTFGTATASSTKENGFTFGSSTTSTSTKGFTFGMPAGNETKTNSSFGINSGAQGGFTFGTKKVEKEKE